MEPIQTEYSHYVAKTLEPMGSFHVHDIWANSTGACELTSKLRDYTCPSRQEKNDKKKLRTTVRVAPVVVLIIACVFLCPWPVYRQVSSSSSNFDDTYTMRAAKMAECQYGCTGSDHYERCAVGCIEIMTENGCKASIICEDCELTFPITHSLNDDCKARCSSK